MRFLGRLRQLLLLLLLLRHVQLPLVLSVQRIHCESAFVVMKAESPSKAPLSPAYAPRDPLTHQTAYHGKTFGMDDDEEHHRRGRDKLRYSGTLHARPPSPNTHTPFLSHLHVGRLDAAAPERTGQHFVKREEEGAGPPRMYHHGTAPLQCGRKRVLQWSQQQQQQQSAHGFPAMFNVSEA